MFPIFKSEAKFFYIKVILAYFIIIPRTFLLNFHHERKTFF